MTVTRGELIEFARETGYLQPDEQPSETDLRVIFWLYSQAHPQEDHN